MHKIKSGNYCFSFMVSNVNSLATVTWEDFASAIPVFKGIDDKKQLMFIKVIGVFYCKLVFQSILKYFTKLLH